jgi:hypothetical protein
VFPLDSFLWPVWPFPAKLSGYRYVRYVLLFISILSCFLARDAFFLCLLMLANGFGVFACQRMQFELLKG